MVTSIELALRTYKVLVDRKVCNRIHNAKDASTHIAEKEMLKSGKKNGASVSMTVSQVVLTQPGQKQESNPWRQTPYYQ